MDIVVNDDLLSIMPLDSLPDTFENFRCAMESRDDLPKPDDLRIKIMEEYQARVNKHEEEMPNAMIAKSNYKKGKEQIRGNSEKFSRPKLICHRCKKAGHRAAVCTAPAPVTDENVAEIAGTISEFAFNHSQTNTVRCDSKQWCLDSGATSDMTSCSNKMKNFWRVKKPISLANNQTTLITGVSEINVKTRNGVTQTLSDTLYVPD